MTGHAGEPPRTNILGVGISALTMDLALRVIDGWIARRERRYVCVATVHSVMEAQRDPTLRAILNRSGLTTPDGMPLVWLSRRLGFPHVERVYGPDLLLALAEHGVERGYRHFFYGGGPGVADRLAARLAERFPGICIAGTYTPPFRPLPPEADAAVVELINGLEPDIVWVGLGCPKQEHWMAEHRERLDAPVLIGVGAAFDFLSGAKRQAPRWMQRSGLEWLFRLAQEPRRLGKRYLVYNPWFVLLVTLQLAGIRRYPEPWSRDLAIQQDQGRRLEER